MPKHEMEMCGHATVGALWCLRRAGLWRSPQATVQTRSGRVRGALRLAGTPDEHIEITQPVGQVQVRGEDAAAAVRQVLGLGPDDEELLPLPLLNASTSRVKTLVALRSVAVLDALAPDFARMQAVCEAIGSTGLYPFAMAGPRVVHARQFPKASGYPEDAATGIAGAALLFGLHHQGMVPVDEAGITVVQGRAMGSRSEIRVRFSLGEAGEPVGCWLGGMVRAD